METIVAVSADPGELENNCSQAITLGSSGVPVSVVHMSLSNQPVQVQAVIQPTQASVIQTAGSQNLQTIQVASVGSDGDSTGTEDDESKKRREILARRPSYRKILNELASDMPSTITVTKIEEESNGSQTSHDSQDMSDGTTNLTSHGIQYQAATVPAQAIQIAAHGDGTGQGLQTLTMSNATQAPGSGATIVQYAQDGQFFIPVSSISAGNVQYQIAPTTLPQGVVMATAGSTITSPQQVTEEASRKRELRLLKNREAARECRRKKKEYVKCLENRVAVLENQNKTLIEELKSLKELYCQKEAQS
ncbi:Cyclic AMP-responsive element-binding protein 1 [Lamellibrachia satsuma]|nr:Cyclic AMP-responsive element-binding protein 1 [Lamellibrachia satsuma]